MSIERFFGKGRAAQAKPRGKDETKPRRSQVSAPDAGTTSPRTSAADAPTSPARSGGGVAIETASVTPVQVEPGPSPSPTYEEISARAYELWQEQGRPEGRDRENWIEAERQLHARR